MSESEPVRSGDRATVVVSPALVLEVSERLEVWLANLSQMSEIDPERESIAMAQKLIAYIISVSNPPTP